MAFQDGLLFLLNNKIIIFYLLSFVFIRFITRCHSPSLIVIFCYSLSLTVPLVVTRCHSLYHSFSFVATLAFIHCHSLSFVAPLVFIHCHSLSFDVTRCTTRLSFYIRSLFYNFLFFTSFVIKTQTKKYLV